MVIKMLGNSMLMKSEILIVALVLSVNVAQMKKRL